MINAIKAIPAPYLVAGGVVAAALLWIMLRGAKGVGMDIGSGAVDLVDGVVTGSVVGVGELVGVPQTDMTACQLAMAEGRTLDASFACPAGTFINYLRTAP